LPLELPRLGREWSGQSKQERMLGALLVRQSRESSFWPSIRTSSLLFVPACPCGKRPSRAGSQSIRYGRSRFTWRIWIDITLEVRFEHFNNFKVVSFHFA